MAAFIENKSKIYLSGDTKQPAIVETIKKSKIPVPPKDAILVPYRVAHRQVPPKPKKVEVKRAKKETKFKMIDSIGPDLNMGSNERVEFPTGLPNANSYTLYVPASESSEKYIKYGYTIYHNLSDTSFDNPILKNNATGESEMFIPPDPDILYTMSDFGLIQMVKVYDESELRSKIKVMSFRDRFLMRERMREEELENVGSQTVNTFIIPGGDEVTTLSGPTTL